MSVTVCKERPDKRSAQERDDGTRSYTRIYYVETNSIQDDAVVVLLAPGLPVLFDKYSTGTTTDIGALCIGRDPVQIGPKNWEVAITYDSKRDDPESGGGGGGGGDQTKPENWFSKVSVTFEKVQVPCPFTHTKPHDVYIAGGDPGDLLWAITNSAGEPYDPVPMRDDYIPVVTFSTFVKWFDSNIAFNHVGKVNSDIFWGATPGQLQITAFETPGMDVKIIKNIEIWHYPVKIEMRFNRDGWNVRLLDAGSYHIVSGKKKSFMTDEGQPCVGLLNGTNGTKLGAGSAPEWITAYTYPETPFSVLGLPAFMPLTP